MIFEFSEPGSHWPVFAFVPKKSDQNDPIVIDWFFCLFYHKCLIDVSCLSGDCLEIATKTFDNYSYNDWKLGSHDVPIESTSFISNPRKNQPPITLEIIVKEFLIGIPTI
ncbi:unnamed protein product, partial [Allacma fusca]